MTNPIFQQSDDDTAVHTEPGWLWDDHDHVLVVELDYGLGILAECAGGGSAGEVASNIATSAIYSCIEQGMRNFDWQSSGDPGAGHPGAGHPALRIRVMILEAIARARARILQLTSHEPRLNGLPTSILIALFHSDQAIVAHVGGAHFYLMRDGRLRLLTRHDASPQQRNADMLLLQEQNSPSCEEILSRCRGLPLSAEINLRTHATLPGDLYLLCSEDVPQLLSAEEIEALLCAYGDHPETAYASLMARVNDHSEHDNSSVILIKLEPASTQMQGFFGRIFSRQA
jgi:serine/threonine protein phosphatase PrpC